MATEKSTCSCQAHRAFHHGSGFAFPASVSALRATPRQDDPTGQARNGPRNRRENRPFSDSLGKSQDAPSPSFRRKPEPSNVKYFWIPGQARDYGSQTCRGAVFSETPSRSSSVDRLSRLGGMNTRTSA